VTPACSYAHLGAEIAERIRTEQPLRALSGPLLKIQDAERRRIARELHDSMGQTLSALSNSLTTARRIAPCETSNGLQTLLSESTAMVDTVTQEIRTLSYLLHPPMLDDLGLEYVLLWYAAGFSKRSGIEVAPDVGRLSSEIERRRSPAGDGEGYRMRDMPEVRREYGPAKGSAYNPLACRPGRVFWRTYARPQGRTLTFNRLSYVTKTFENRCDSSSPRSGLRRPHVFVAQRGDGIL
jgi:hypothetical protein